MKKIILLSIISIFGVISCKKNSDLKRNTSTDNYTSQTTMRPSTISGLEITGDGYLYFASPDNYDAVLTTLTSMTDSALNVWESQNEYTSAYSYYGIGNIDADDSLARTELSSSFHNKNFYDPFILRLINSDGIVRIGDYLFNFRMDDGYILQMYANDTEIVYNDFKKGIFDVNYMNQLSNKDLDSLGDGEDIFDLLGTGVVGLRPVSQLRDLFGNREVTFEPSGPISQPDAHNPYVIKLVSAYQAAIIYKSWIAKFKHYTQGSGNILFASNTEINLEYADSYAEYRRNRENNWTTKIPTTSDVYYTMTNRYKVEWRIYETWRGRGLSGRDGLLKWRYWDNYNQTYAIMYQNLN